MGKVDLTVKEQLVLYGILKYPMDSDKNIAEKMGIKHSTVTAIRHRLLAKNYFRTVTIPRLQNLGSNLLVVIYTNFSPLIPLEERVKITGKTIEVFEEIFFSVGDQEKGFSLSLSQDYATIGRINDIRTETFGSRGLLEDEYPHMVVFPFEISKLYRFFDVAPLFRKYFNLNVAVDDIMSDVGLVSKKKWILSKTQKETYSLLVQYPNLSDSAVGEKLGVSRHTISRIRRDFEEHNLLRKVNLPNFKQLGFEILTFYHIRFDPRNPPDFFTNEAESLLSESTIFFASRRFEAVMISVYAHFDEFKQDSTRVMQVLKEHSWIAQQPIIITFSLRNLSIIKNFIFTPIAKKIVGSSNSS